MGRSLSSGRRVFRKDEVPTAPEQIKTVPAPAAAPEDGAPAPVQTPAAAATPVAKTPRLRKDGTPWGKTGPAPSAVPLRACNVSLPESLWDALDDEVAERMKDDRRFNRSVLIEEIVKTWKNKKKPKNSP